MPFWFGRVAALWMPGTFGSLLRSRVRVGVSPDVLLWKRRAIRCALTADRLKNAVERAESRYHEVHMRLEARRQSGLDHDVLRQVLPVRAAELPVSAREREEAKAREADLLARSDVYRNAMDASAASPPVRRTEIDGLPWWVPLDERGDERVQRLQRQGFPYRAILQTREVAIGGFMVDIGANIGRTSIPRIMLGDMRAVYAAEPEPANYACLVRNVIEHNLRGLVLPDRVAIGAARGEARMHRSRHVGGHRVLDGGERSLESFAVEVWPLDDWVARLGIDIAALTFVKVDSQGSELDVLRGAPGLLARRHISWQIEIDPGLLQRRHASVSDVVDVLRSRFSHFIDIGSPQPGRRVRTTSELAESVAYLGERQRKTDLLLFHGAS